MASSTVMEGVEGKRQPVRGHVITPYDKPAQPSPGTFEDSYRSLWPRMVRLAHLLLGSLALAEEIAQEAFVGLWRNIDAVDDLGAYVRRSVVNLSTNARQRRDRESNYVTQIREEFQAPPQVDETWRALAVLPVRQRAALVLRYYEDLSEQAIAEVLGCRPGTVKSLTSRGLARLREELES
jgi:RNA polymerase sigma-70 factor (sigma-E family)